jgi:hypothetical protein
MQAKGVWAAVWGTVALGVWLVAAAAPARGDCVSADTVVHAGLFASGNNITPGTEFDVNLQITRAGQCFNTFDATIAWDTNALTFLQLSPLSQQEGSLMKNACSNRFHMFTAGSGTADITDGLLCNLVFVSGPGQAYRLHFRASNTPQVTYVRLLGLHFFEAGIYYRSPDSTDAVVGIGVTIGVGDPPPARLALAVTPNPARGELRFAVEADRPGTQRLSVRDVQGRLVARLADGWFPAGPRTVAWDGHDAAGRRLSPGVYLVTLEVAGGSTSRRVALLQ